MAEIPDHYQFVDNPPAKSARAFKRHIYSPEYEEEIRDEIGEELPLTETQQKQFGDVLAATVKYYSDHHGVDIWPRMPMLGNIHMLSDENFFALIKKEGTQYEGFNPHGFKIGMDDMVFRDSGDAARNAYFVQHELVHVLGQRMSRLRETEGSIELQVVRQGLEGRSRRGGSSAMEEYTVEQTARDIIRNYWPGFESLQQLHPTFTAHEGAIELGDVVAEGSGLGQEGLLHSLQATHLTGDLGPLGRVAGAVEGAWGSEAKRELATTISARAGELAVKLSQDQKP